MSKRIHFLPFWSGNPYHRLLKEQLARFEVQVFEANGRYWLGALRREDVLHLHTLHQSYLSTTWALSFIKLVFFLAQLLLARLRGVRVVWTVHEFTNHENIFPLLGRWCNFWVAWLADAFIVHCDVAKSLLIDQFGVLENRIFVIPHGNFIDVYPNHVSRLQAREVLDIPTSKRVLLFLGLIRPYKGVPELIDAFGEVAGPNDLLVIAGKFYDTWKPLENHKRVIHQKLKEVTSTRFMPGYVSDEALQFYFNACDAVVLPYQTILTSGALVLAMSFGKACIAPRLGCLQDTLDERGGILYENHRPEGLQRALSVALSPSTNLKRMGAYNRRRILDHSWSTMAESTYNVYCGL